MAQEVLAGRHALVTGGAQGLGAGMAQALAAAGAQVMIGDLQDDLAAQTAEGLGGRSTHLDVTDEASWEAAVGATVEQLGGFDILVNNAGIEISSLIVDIEAARPQEDARGQRPRHRARHQARSAGDAARRCGGPGRRDRQHLVRRGDDRVPRDLRLLGDEVGGRPADPGRRVRGRQARLRRARQLRLSGPGPDGDGHAARRRHGRARPLRQPRGGRRRRRRADAARASGRGARHGRRRRLPRVRPGALHHRASACRSTAEWGCDDGCPRSSTTWTRARRSAATRRVWCRASGR